ncbi:MAG: hypothetical protein ACLSG5_14900 [Oscillospiraceae bacterium]
MKISTDLNDGEIYEMEKAKDEWRDSRVRPQSDRPSTPSPKRSRKLMRAAGISSFSRPVVRPLPECRSTAASSRFAAEAAQQDVKHEVRISVPQLTGENVTIVAHKEWWMM